MRLWTTLIKSDCAFLHKIIQTISRKFKIMLAVLFGIKRKIMLAKPNNAKKRASTIGKSLALANKLFSVIINILQVQMVCRDLKNFVRGG